MRTANGYHTATSYMCAKLQGSQCPKEVASPRSCPWKSERQCQFRCRSNCTWHRSPTSTESSTTVIGMSPQTATWPLAFSSHHVELGNSDEELLTVSMAPSPMSVFPWQEENHRHVFWENRYSTSRSFMSLDCWVAHHSAPGQRLSFFHDPAPSRQNVASYGNMSNFFTVTPTRLKPYTLPFRWLPKHIPERATQYRDSCPNPQKRLHFKPKSLEFPLHWVSPALETTLPKSYETSLVYTYASCLT